MGQTLEEIVPKKYRDSSRRARDGELVAGILEPCGSPLRWCEEGKIKAIVRCFLEHRDLQLSELVFTGIDTKKDKALVFFKLDDKLDDFEGKVLYRFDLDLLVKKAEKDEIDEGKDLGEYGFHLTQRMKGKGKRAAASIMVMVDYDVVRKNLMRIRSRNMDGLTLPNARKNLTTIERKHFFELENGIDLDIDT